MYEFFCPHCFKIHKLKELSMKCSYRGREKVEVCPRGVSKDQEGWILNKKASICLKCANAKKNLYCPTRRDKEISRSFTEEESLSIALVGAIASGKSNYIGVLIEEMRHTMLGKFDCSMYISCNDESKKYYDEMYYKPLYTMSSVVPATCEVDVPSLIVPLCFNVSKKFLKSKTVNLLFRDEGNDSWVTEEEWAIRQNYIHNAGGIMFFIDPLQIPRIAMELKDKVSMPARAECNVVESIEKLICILRDNLENRRRINKPIAFIITKSDILEKYGIIPAEDDLLKESSHIAQGRYVLSEHSENNREGMEFLGKWIGEEIEFLMKNFERCSVFFVSSLGEEPVKGRIENLHPRKVLDPFLWLLAEKKYIKSVK